MLKQVKQDEGKTYYAVASVLSVEGVLVVVVVALGVVVLFAAAARVRVLVVLLAAVVRAVRVLVAALGVVVLLAAVVRVVVLVVRAGALRLGGLVEEGVRKAEKALISAARASCTYGLARCHRVRSSVEVLCSFSSKTSLFARIC